MVTEITPLFRLAELGLSETIMTNLEAHFVSELVTMEQLDTLSRIAGLDATARYILAGAIRDLYLRKTAELKALEDPGIQRLYAAMTAEVQHVRMGRDFFRLTREKSQIIRDVLNNERELYRPDVAEQCLTLRFGLGGGPELTVEECARHTELGLSTNWEVQQVITRNLRVIAIHIVPHYAMTTIGDPAQIHLDYLAAYNADAKHPSARQDLRDAG